MKKLILISVVAVLCANFALGQDHLLQSKVSALVVSHFLNDYPSATDVEWEMEEDLYKVEFETGNDIDHDMWYKPTGEIVKHKEDIAASELPEGTIARIMAKFDRYQLDDIEKITTESDIYYSVELKSPSQDLEVEIYAMGRLYKMKNEEIKKRL